MYITFLCIGNYVILPCQQSGQSGTVRDGIIR